MTKIINHTSEDGIMKWKLVKQNENKYKTWYVVPAKKVLEYLKVFHKNGYFLLKNGMGTKGAYVLGDKGNNIVAFSFMVKPNIYTFQVLKTIYKGEK